MQTKEAQRRARRRASKARYRARHPDRIAAAKQRYRAKRKTKPPSGDDDDDEDVDDELADLQAKQAQRRTSQARYRARHPDRVVASRQRYREKQQRAKRLAYQKWYYDTHAERLRAYQRQRRQTEEGRRWRAQFKRNSERPPP